MRGNCERGGWNFGPLVLLLALCVRLDVFLLLLPHSSTPSPPLRPSLVLLLLLLLLL